MYRRSRTRRIAKWTGVVMCIFILAGSILSIGWDFNFVVPGFHLLLDRGWLTVMWWPGGPYNVKETFWTARHDPSVSVMRLGWPGYQLPKSHWYGRAVWMPLWLPLVALTMTTGGLFYRDRRRIPSGHCPRCGYNLTGNVSGVCSECGDSNRPTPEAV